MTYCPIRTKWGRFWYNCIIYEFSSLVVCDTSFKFRFLVIRKQKVVMSRFDKYAASISESIIQMTFLDQIKRKKIVFLCVWFFLLQQQFLNTYYIICLYVEDTGGLSNYQTHRQRRRDIIHACTKVKYSRRKKMKLRILKTWYTGERKGAYCHTSSFKCHQRYWTCLSIDCLSFQLCQIKWR